MVVTHEVGARMGTTMLVEAPADRSGFNDGTEQKYDIGISNSPARKSAKHTYYIHIDEFVLRHLATNLSFCSKLETPSIDSPVIFFGTVLYKFGGRLEKDVELGTHSSADINK